MKYYLDTNIISYFLRGSENIRNKILELLQADNEIKLPRVVFYESERGLLATRATTKLNRFLVFAKSLGIEEMQPNTFTLAAKIYADLSNEGKLIEDDDIFIGATALEHDAILVTNNPRHLSRIKDLKIEIWEI